MDPWECTASVKRTLNARLESGADADTPDTPSPRCPPGGLRTLGTKDGVEAPDAPDAPVAPDAPNNLEQLEDAIAELSAHIQAATYRLLCLVRDFDQREGWASGEFVSCAHWLAWRTGDDLVTAREKVRVARALSSLPRISAAFAQAELSYSKVRAMTRVATATNEQDLLVMGREATASQLERVVRAVRRAPPLQLEQAQLQYDSRQLHYHTNDQGMLELQARLCPEAGALVIKALEAATEALDSRGEDKEQGAEDEASAKHPSVRVHSFSQRQADALVLLAESALDHDLACGSHADRYQVVVHVNAETLTTKKRLSSARVDADPQVAAELQVAAESQVATEKNSAEGSGQSELENGVGLCAETSRRLTCCSSLVPLTEDKDGNPLHVGRRTRRPSAALDRALKSRDRGCQFPGCTHTRYVEAHHIVHWANGGKTALDNMVLLCSHHHRAVHELGFSVTRNEQGALVFLSPRGTPLPSSPMPRVLRGEPLDRLREEHARAGVEITADSGGPLEFTGTPLDLGDAVSLLLPDQGRTWLKTA